MSSWKTIGLAAMTLVLNLGLYYLGLRFNGAGHGSVFFAAVMVAPLGIVMDWEVSLSLWFAVGGLMVSRNIEFCRTAAGVVLGVHYLGIAILSIGTDWESVGRVFSAMPGLVLLFVVAYIGNQMMMWHLILESKAAPKLALT